VPWVRVDGDRLLSDRELGAVPVEDRPTRRRDLDRRVMLAARQAVERLRLDRLEPDGATERSEKGEDEEDEQQPDAPIQ
jgi:hypothetical protein